MSVPVYGPAPVYDFGFSVGPAGLVVNGIAIPGDGAASEAVSKPVTDARAEFLKSSPEIVKLRDLTARRRAAVQAAADADRKAEDLKAKRMASVLEGRRDVADVTVRLTAARAEAAAARELVADLDHFIALQRTACVEAWRPRRAEIHRKMLDDVRQAQTDRLEKLRPFQGAIAEYAVGQVLEGWLVTKCGAMAGLEQLDLPDDLR